MARSSTIATKFLVLSDTDEFEFSGKGGGSHPLQRPTPIADALLHCDDLTQVGGVSSCKKALKMLGSIDAELKLVIPGNHNSELDRVYWEIQRDGNATPKDHDLAVNIMAGPLAVAAGVSCSTEGTHSFAFEKPKFATYVSPYTPAFCVWAFTYEHNQDRFNASHQVANSVTSIAMNPIPDIVDVIMSHGPANGILDWWLKGNVGGEKR